MHPTTRFHHLVLIFVFTVFPLIVPPTEASIRPLFAGKKGHGGAGTAAATPSFTLWAAERNNVGPLSSTAPVLARDGAFYVGGAPAMAAECLQREDSSVCERRVVPTVFALGEGNSLWLDARVGGRQQGELN
ncbi:hypothetical protein BDY21DRAFT_166455 [Lineolata rhizophorae]|uniref:Glyoxal oxidase N-terminus-domain-containing protein n=1 Tax=Lineolata rhizophorae TaxID=578093 RepID=A0A6A6P9F1_9PEZI|nr:hypothetical protein BDY21DRAFT_166455 [Lineolata rhizophorae]